MKAIHTNRPNLSLCALLASMLLFVGCSSVDNVKPSPNPALNPDLLREVMLFGGTGTIGDGILKALIQEPAVKRIHVVTRRETDRIKAGAKSGKVNVIKHRNYLDYSSLNERLKTTTTVYWALGTAASNVDDKTYTKIHVDFPLAFMKSWLAAGAAPSRSFHLVTGAGTSETSWFHWAREKAKAEVGLKKMAQGSRMRIIAYRPGFILPTSERAGAAKRIFFPLLGAVKALHIGRSMMEAAVRPTEMSNGVILNSGSIKDFARAYAKRNKLDD